MICCPIGRALASSTKHLTELVSEVPFVALAAPRWWIVAVVTSWLPFLLPSPAGAASATLRPGKDATIFGNGDANLSDGGSAYLFAGSSGENRKLRSLIAFTLDGQIPAGATITSARLTLAINTPLAGHSNTVQLHRVLADWGEGTTAGAKGGGGGAPAVLGDATWSDAFFNRTKWSAPGGDFFGSVSASQPVSGNSGNVTFASAGLTADVQAWVNTPSINFGWIMVAQNESGRTAVRFWSREGQTLAPTLAVEYTVPSGTAPEFTTQPASQAVAAGATITLTAAASGAPAPAFQWRRSGTPIAGATDATLTLTRVTIADTGSYTVVAANAAGSVASAPAVVMVNSSIEGTAARLSNLSVRAAMALGQTLFVGFSVNGGSRPILVRAVGPTLASFGLQDTMADPRLELYNGSTLVGQNDDWGDSAAMRNSFGGVGAFALLADSRDAAMLQPVDGTRTAQLKGSGPGVILVELYDTGTGISPRLVNVSARNQVGTGDNILILGFFIDGAGTKNVLVRAIGPTLADLGVGGALADPKVEVFREGTTAAIASNDNWDRAHSTIFGAVGAFPLSADSKDAALVTTLTPGSYTVQVSGVNGGTGEALVEIYEVP